MKNQQLIISLISTMIKYGFRVTVLSSDDLLATDDDITIAMFIVGSSDKVFFKAVNLKESTIINKFKKVRTVDYNNCAHYVYSDIPRSKKISMLGKVSISEINTALEQYKSREYNKKNMMIINERLHS